MGKKTKENLNPIKMVKNVLKNPLDPGGHMDELKGFMKPKIPGEDPAVTALRERQAEESAELDEEENRRIKQLLSGTQGARSYRGSPLFRGRPSNTAGVARSAAGGGSASPGAAGLRAGGMRGGIGRVMRSLAG